MQSSIYPTNLGDEYVTDDRLPSSSSAGVVSFRQLKDTDPFPFGHFKSINARMQDVPARVLDGWRDAHWMDRYPAVQDYIERNAKAIDLELRDEDRRGR